VILATFFNEWDSLANWVITVGAVLSAWALMYKFIWLPTQRWFTKLDAGVNSILGYGPVVDPGTGLVLQAETEPLAVRVKRLEDVQAQTADALSRLAENHDQLARIQASQDDLKSAIEGLREEFEGHLQLSQDWIHQHEQEHHT